MRKLLYIHILSITILSIIACSSSKEATNSAKAKHDKKYIDSLVLVKALHVNIVLADPLFKTEVAEALINTLKSRGFKLLSKEETEGLYQDFINESSGAHNLAKMVEGAENAKHDKEYFLKVAEAAEPYVQSILLKPCKDGSKNCITIERANPPNYRKKKSWVFEYKETDNRGKLINQIIETLTAQNPPR